MNDNADGDAVTETTDACADNDDNTPMELANTNGHASKTALNHKTTVIVPSGDADIANFMLSFGENSHFAYLVTWVVLLSSSPDLSILSSRLPRLLLCNLILIEIDGDSVVRVAAATDRYWNCTLREHLRAEPKTCQPYRRVTDSIRDLNASIVHEEVDLIDFAQSLLRKQCDIYMSHVALSKWRLQDLDFPAVTHYSYLTFYVRGNSTRPLLVGTVMAKSKTALLLLFGSLSSCFVVLLVMDRLGGNRQGYDTATRTLFFLVASFYANSTRVPSSRPWKLSRNILVFSWILGTFTLTIYIDGELTSWLSVKVPADVVDTLDELSDGIEKRAVWPCVVNLSVFHYLSTRPSNHTLLKTLHEAYNAYGESMVYANVRSCLQCATRDDAVCLVSTVNKCFTRIFSEGIKRGEDFGQLFSSTPVRKDFPLKNSYRALIRRLSETGCMRSISRSRCETSTRFEHAVDEHLTLSSLYVLYFGCVATSVLVLTLELCVFYSTVTSKMASVGETVEEPTLCPVESAERLTFHGELAILAGNEKMKGC
ncbi:hypothetical protein HPB51_015135 [Rhipicephalus microplus]|uniref:Ionotropic glutamate receptor C-terminal domain-containing protein n=1 Tax=Rhipicephalus microplus TaxID=6941 RepID=A0A9J6DNA9_RHIMP|nr:hypothetical protein HPB51_015135 [Rhipicephalus microplus]